MKYLEDYPIHDLQINHEQTDDELYNYVLPVDDDKVKVIAKRSAITVFFLTFLVVVMVLLPIILIINGVSK